MADEAAKAAAAATPGADELSRLVQGFSGKAVLVVGDVIADHYLWGEATRISREAPVLILEYAGERITPGGAANAAANVRSLGGRALVVAAVGDDSAGQALRRELQQQQMDTQGLVAARGRRTCLKTRILGGGRQAVKQQLVRIDRSVREPWPEATAQALCDAVRRLLPQCDAVLVSDYGQGVVTPALWQEILQGARQRGIPVAVDSRYQLAAFQGATVVTPNQVEAEEALGRRLGDVEAVAGAAWDLRRRLASEAVIITRGEEGMVLVADRQAWRLPAYQPAAVYDVTGAGDTVIAALCLGRAAGAAWLHCALLANLAAGLSVRRSGATAVTAGEVAAALAGGAPLAAEVLPVPDGGCGAVQAG
ncbi:MAG: bifunctional hydroxymethylpyrimidine kinase/phosphomethylpyrimidine kinase [Firmicutes bacterium]|nr:bifunctional hydroxymethylpyrimidine kinase/phosphomethylpyrimidine kinase [Bacillota bacterium]